jgi:hypothetical protein
VIAIFLCTTAMFPYTGMLFLDNTVIFLCMIAIFLWKTPRFLCAISIFLYAIAKFFFNSLSILAENWRIKPPSTFYVLKESSQASVALRVDCPLLLASNYHGFR